MQIIELAVILFDVRDIHGRSITVFPMNRFLFVDRVYFAWHVYLKHKTPHPDSFKTRGSYG